jgi:hypothetical protein
VTFAECSKRKELELDFQYWISSFSFCINIELLHKKGFAAAGMFCSQWGRISFSLSILMAFS